MPDFKPLSWELTEIDRDGKTTTSTFGNELRAHDAFDLGCRAKSVKRSSMICIMRIEVSSHNKA